VKGLDIWSSVAARATKGLKFKSWKPHDFL